MCIGSLVTKNNYQTTQKSEINTRYYQEIKSICLCLLTYLTYINTDIKDIDSPPLSDIILTK